MASNAKTDHAGETIQQLVQLHESHERRATSLQRFANRVTGILSRPASFAVTILLAAGWIAGNHLVARLGVRPTEQLPFPDLELAATIAALLVALLILTTQRHEQDLADKRAQLTLQIAILSERKIAKLIQLIEEQRQENPLLESRIDPEAEALAVPVDPLINLERLEASHGSSPQGANSDPRSLEV